MCAGVHVSSASINAPVSTSHKTRSEQEQQMATVSTRNQIEAIKFDGFYYALVFVVATAAALKKLDGRSVCNRILFFPILFCFIFTSL